MSPLYIQAPTQTTSFTPGEVCNNNHMLSCPLLLIRIVPPGTKYDSATTKTSNALSHISNVEQCPFSNITGYVMKYTAPSHCLLMICNVNILWKEYSTRIHVSSLLLCAAWFSTAFCQPSSGCKITTINDRISDWHRPIRQWIDDSKVKMD